MKKIILIIISCIFLITLVSSNLILYSNDFKDNIKEQELSNFNYSNLKQYNWNYVDEEIIFEFEENKLINITSINKTKSKINYGFLVEDVPSYCRDEISFNIECLLSDFIVNQIKKNNAQDLEIDVLRQAVYELNERVKVLEQECKK